MHTKTLRRGLICAFLALPWLAACGDSGGGGGGDNSSYEVGGSISGLEGDQLILSLNNDESLTIQSDGSFEFSTELEDGSSYTVSPQVLPESPVQNCDLSNASGTVSGDDVSDIDINCHQAIKMLGRVAGPPIDGATITATVGDDEYEAAADEQGMYELRLSVRETDDMVSLVARDQTDDFIHYQSYLGSMERVRNLATADGLLTREQAIAANITNVSTANAALMRWANDGEAPATEAERLELREQFAPSLMLRSAALIQIAVEDPDRDIIPLAAGGSWESTSAEDTAVLIEDESERTAYENQVNESDPEKLDNTVDAILSDEDLVEGIEEEDVPDSWFGIHGPAPTTITGVRYTFSEDNTGTFSNHVDSASFTWDVDNGKINIILDDPLTSAGFCFVPDDDGNEYQTACVTEYNTFVTNLVEKGDTVDVLSIQQSGTTDYPDEPERPEEDFDTRSDLFGHGPDSVELLTEADIADTTWGMPGDFPALVGGLPWYGDELLQFVSGGTGQASESGAFNWSFTDSGWLRIDFGSGTTHEVALFKTQRDPVWRARFRSRNDSGEPRSIRSMIAPQLDTSGLDAAFASDLFVQWAYQSNNELAFAIDLREDGWGGPRNVEKATDAILDFQYEFDYRFDAGDLIMESWAQPQANGEVWWGRQSICGEGDPDGSCHLTMRRTWTLLHDDDEWISILERIENLDENGDYVSYSPRVIQYQRYTE